MIAYKLVLTYIDSAGFPNVVDIRHFISQQKALEANCKLLNFLFENQIDTNTKHTLRNYLNNFGDENKKISDYKKEIKKDLEITLSKYIEFSLTWPKETRTLLLHFFSSRCPSCEIIEYELEE